MADKHHHLFDVTDRSYFALIKKDIHQLAVKAGFPEAKVGRIDIIVAEMVTNLVKHANGGQLIVKILDEGMEIISIDNGPGIADIRKMLQDGVSTKNTLGHGLGSMKRLSDVFEIFTQKGWGTIILSRNYIGTVKNTAVKSTEISSVILPKPGETVCGDGLYIKTTKDKIQILLGDGLGHGPEAAKAIDAAKDAFSKTTPGNTPVDSIRELHAAVRKTRGLVATIATFYAPQKKWRLCGVGNISTKIGNFQQTKNHMAYNGIIGHNIPNTMKDQEIDYEAGQYLIMCSDGIRTRWDVYKYPGILKNDLSILTAAIYKDHTRNTDDASVVAVKINL